MKVLILGGDGYLGWPTAMQLSKHGHEVTVVDNYLRRRLCLELGVDPLFPVPNLIERGKLWKEISGASVDVVIGDVCNYDFISKIFDQFKPDAVVHYAEQPSAPYSMIGQRTASLTLSNNLQSTLNVAWAVHRHVPECHIVKLGTMGEYGTPNIDIEEGWIEIEHKGRADRFLYPRQAGSLYHTTKIQDTDLLWFYVRTWGIRVTDLMQGPVYGLVTNENEGEPQLYPFLNYDEVFGTVLNRFIVQAVAEYPLTVFGRGNQKRGYLDIRDTLQCVHLAIEHPPDPGRLRILNQFVEVFSVNQLADTVRRIGRELGLRVEIRSVKNPRKEAEEHYYNPVNSGLLELGLKPHRLSDEVVAKLLGIVMGHKERIRRDVIFTGIQW